MESFFLSVSFSLKLLHFIVISSFFCIQCAKKKKAKGAPGQDYLPPTSCGTDEVKFTTSEANANQPKRAPANKKEEMIKKGMLIRRKDDYPTMDDVASDWEEVADENKLDTKRGTSSVKPKKENQANASKKKKKALS